jgi:hypothetical protein
MSLLPLSPPLGLFLGLSNKKWGWACVGGGCPLFGPFKGVFQKVGRERDSYVLR